MNFDYSPEQREFQLSLRRFLLDQAPVSRVRQRLGARGYDREIWQRLCGEFGLTALSVDEALGGAGFSVEESAVAFEELGRALTSVPLAATTFAIEAIVRLGSEEQKGALLPSLLSGASVGTLAALDAKVRAVAQAAAGSDQVTCSVTGRVSPVLDGDSADLLLLPVDIEGIVRLVVLNTDDAGVTVNPLPSLDATRPFAEITLSGAHAQLMPGSMEQLEDVLDLARILLAAEMVGVASRCLDVAVDYAKSRIQFNRPIGSFQAIKHRAADMAIQLDAARSATMYATFAAATGQPDLNRAAPIANAVATDAVELCAGSMLQILGGIGFTWEHDAHLYYRRAKTDAALLGSSASNRMLLADRAMIGATS